MNTSIGDVDAVFTHWLGAEYDLDALHAVLAAAAAERLDGDTPWLLLISGPGNAKTETVSALEGAGAIVTSTIASEAALLSATPKREKSKDATGGLLRKIGPSGALVIKDVTSILAMNRDTRGGVLAALREIYDGYWCRNVGTDGGRSIEWRGRIAIVGACTTAWDQAHAVIASMGDRFALVRMDSSRGRLAAGQQAIRNTGHEGAMRQALREAAGAVLARVTGPGTTLADAEDRQILAAANIVTLCRTAVEYDFRGDIIDAHAPEMPTRLAKQLTQIMRGGVAIGLDRQAALRLAIRCARDSMPPLRLAILEDVATFPRTTTRDVRKRLEKPYNTIDRQLQALHMLNVLRCEDEEREAVAGKSASIWRYSISEGIDPDALTVPDLSVDMLSRSEEREQCPDTDIPGTTQCDCLKPDCALCDGPDRRAVS
jgi:hypothetical protein